MRDLDLLTVTPWGYSSSQRDGTQDRETELARKNQELRQQLQG